MSLQTAAKWVVYGALFTIPFIPLYVANELFFPFITGKGFAFRVLVEIAFAGWVVLALSNKAYRPRFSWVFVLYGAFIFWMLIADLFGVNAHKALWSNFERMEGWVTLIHVFLFFVVSGSVLSMDKKWRAWWLTFISAAMLVTFTCLLQLMCAGQACGAPGQTFAIHQGGVRVDGTFGNAAYLAAYLLFATAIAFWQALESRGWLRWSLFALAALEVLVIYFTATRGAILALVGASIVGSLLWAFESGAKSRKVALGIFVGLVVLAGGFYLVKDSAFVKADPTLARISAIGPADLQVRLTLWSMALEGVAERPITGWGQEGYNYVFNQHYRPSLFAQEPWFDRAHNAFIDWLVAGGIPGFLLFLAAFALAIRALYRGEASRAERVLLITALTAYAIQGMVVFDNLFTYVPLAAILATAHAASSRPVKKFETLPAMREIDLQIAAPVVAVILFVTLWFVNVPNIAAASQLVQAISVRSNDVSPNVVLFQQALDQNSFGQQEVREQFMSFTNNVASGQSAPSQALTQLITFALTEMSKEVERQPHDARLRLEYALGLRVAGDYENALKQLAIAYEDSPKKQSILIEQGFNYWQSGQMEKAAESLRMAYAVDPSFDRLVPYAAAGDILVGNVAGAKALLTERLGAPIIDSEPLILAYYQIKDFPDLIATLTLQVENQKGSAESYFRLAAAYLAAGQPGQARATVAKAVAAHPEAASQAKEFLSRIPN
jgi:O-antigen ligase/tetratricopeptide (TPR) repeat protein